jgi:hemolysin D
VPLRVPHRDRAARLWQRELVLEELDYLTTPPCPVHMGFILIFCGLFAFALIVSVIIKIDTYAIAQARVEPAGGSRFVQPLATGTVDAIHVANGDYVHKGDLLAELDPTDSSAERSALTDKYNALSAEIARRVAANAVVRKAQWGSTPAISFDAKIPVEIQTRERRMLAADLTSLQSELRVADARIEENKARKAGAEGTIAEQEKLVAAWNKRVELLKEADSQQTKSSVIDAERSLAIASTRLADLKGQQRNAEAAIRSQITEKEQAVAHFVAANTQALADVEARRDELTQSLVKPNLRFNQTRLLAPIDGIVQDSMLTAVGQVVSPGQHLLTVVPNDSPVEVVALVSTRDIGFIRMGQRAVLKLDAFPFMRYGTLPGTIVHISGEATSNEQAFASGHASESETVSQDVVFAVTVKLDRASVVVDQKSVSVLPGMTGRLEILTGQPRAIEYVLSPILEAVSGTGHKH